MLDFRHNPLKFRPRNKGETIMGRTIPWATLVAGTLDIMFAAILSLIRGGAPANMLRFVASGPFPAATGWGAAGAWLGLATHFALMAIVAAASLSSPRPPRLTAADQMGIIYGLITYVVMNRSSSPALPRSLAAQPIGIATQLFAHIVLVGIPIALTAARRLRTR